MNERRTTLSALFGLTVVLSSTAAQAQDQPWLRDERLQDSPGYEGERFRVTGGVQGGASYDSNVFLRAGTSEAPRADAFVLSVTPFLGFSTRDQDGRRSPVNFRGSAAVSYYEYIPGPTKGLPTDDVSGERNFGATGSAAALFAMGPHVTSDLHGSITRSIQPSNLGDPSASYNRTVPSVGVGVGWMPGGGLFDWRVGYDLSYTYFEADRFQLYNNFAHRVGSVASWRFLPRTRLFSQVEYVHFNYTAVNTPQSNGDGITTRVGIDGLFTNSVGFLASLGWASTFFNQKAGEPEQDYDSLVAQAELRFYLSAPPKRDDQPGLYPSVLAFGYVRDWNQSFVGNYYHRDRGYASLGYFFNGKILATLGVGVARLSFPAAFFPNGVEMSPAFAATEADASVFLEYRFTPHFGVNLSGVYSQFVSDARIRGDENNPLVGQDYKWTRFVATLGVRYLF